MVESQKGWYLVRFKIKILDNTHEYGALVNRPDSPIHSLIANEILRPIIEQYGENGEKIYPWRFHRLFWVEKRQHQFNFRFCASIDSHIDEEINTIINDHSIRLEMNDLGLLEGVYFSKEGPDGEPNLWSDEINKCWPHFIFGVSRAWLELIKTFEKREIEKGTSHNNIKERLEFYARINNYIREQWFKFGDHSMLHHLNAVFGYNPTNVRVGIRFKKGHIKSLATFFDPLPTNMGDIPILQGIEAQMSL